MEGRLPPLAVSGSLLLVVGSMTILALGFGAGARHFPLIAGAATSALLVAQVGRDLLGLGGKQKREGRSGRRLLDPAASLSDSGTAPAPDQSEGESKGTTAPRALGWITALAVMFVLAGLVAATAVFAAFFMTIYGRERWRTVALSIAGMLAVLLTLASIVDAPLYLGIIGEWLGL